MFDTYGERRAVDANGTPLSDEAVRAAADFGIFVDLASLCQKQNGVRTETETALFGWALENLDVIYAHKALATLLSTKQPDGVNVDRSYDARGCAMPRTPRARATRLVADCRSPCTPSLFARV